MSSIGARMGRAWPWLREQWEAINREAEAERASKPGLDGEAMAALIVVALVLVFEEYCGDRPTFERLFNPWRSYRYFQLGSFAWWSGAKVVGYLIVPAIFIKLSGKRIADYGFSLSGIRKHLWIYAALYLAVLPAVILASTTKPFLLTYPFYKYTARSWIDFWCWEALYGLSFLALEFFFRGFFLFALKRAMGAYAIFAMIVPYCMIHFHKPVTECCGAIFAGVILGTLAMMTRSIWCGVFIHVSVAWTMDMLAVAQTTGLPGSGRFVG
jgi:hypothetical protein